MSEAHDAIPLDQDALGELRAIEASGDEPGFLRETIDAYIADASKSLGALKKAAQEGRVQDVAKEAHSLRGSSALVGASVVAARCAAIERYGRQGQLDAARAELAALQGEIERSTKSLLLERDR